MKIKEIAYTPTFKKAFQKLPKKIQLEAVNKEKIFRQDAFASELRTHKLKGKFKDYYSFSLAYSYRVVFRFLKQNQVLFVDCGDHSVYG
ncbi:MAG: hypothetical protein A3A61_04285 [Candidatus Woykebacteria bacterium RIFCSPLOWO2_01_FULL_43_14]|uniref:Type II toxin-antitoxin system mRNA interferase toxin, RelE/StbE family n=2 Tax=Candidatus Woykeibacteriota TaxID=1817899 RepID=A0A1G1WYR2_9BACT|nr:MAG: hypothetical protein A3J50_02585 [Candidatus Woykebacteria bacterium RIFCSPHIGHO2_02_FULL_43_16b]OGY32277.1 MAG: hypothetical protein A3A61_04285 [Candidatus Woykebacteria bacterium RIFCSPLOWO2_01_FULL_43_14]